MTIRRAVAILLLLLPLAVRSAAGQRDPVVRFDRALMRVLEPGAAEMPWDHQMEATAMRGVWNAMDTLVLSRLRVGDDLAAIDSLLRTLRGYAPATAGDGDVVGHTQFYRTLPRHAPSYMVAALDSPATVVVGVYNLTMASAGRVSVFARRAGRWSRVGGFQAANPVRVLSRPTGAGRWGMATVETFTGADRRECFLKLWTVSAGAMRRDTAYAGRLLDCEVTETDDGIHVAFSDYPRALSAGLLGVRLGWDRTLRVAGGRLRADADRSLNPWVLVAEQYFARRGTPAAARLLARPALAHDLGSGRPDATADEGNLQEGTGWLTVRTAVGGSESWQRILSARGADGRWRIVDVQPAADPSAGQ
ncbi:MAG TPA: hypothetical protein VFH27_10965 [Longimicrobiaceae bacterium]|nr:hypothetical protein [Longimicrobiaceae bacterium]